MTLPPFFIIDKKEMLGKYGWFKANEKYKLDVYYSGWQFENEKSLNLYKNIFNKE
jgi:hypothetical protein